MQMLEEPDIEVESESIEAANVFYEAALWQLQDQMARIDAMDRKLAAMFTLTAAVLAVFAAGLTLRESGLSTTAWALLIVVVATFGANVVSSYLAYRDRDWRLNPRLEDLDRAIRRADVDESAARYWAALEMRDALTANEQAIQRKKWWLRASHALMAIDLVLAATTVVVVTSPLGV